MNIDIYYNLMLLIFLPLLVIQTRFLLYKRSLDNERKEASQILSEIVPDNLLIIGMTLCFASVAVISLNDSLTALLSEIQLQYFQWAVFLFALIIPLSGMFFISISNNKARRISVGVLIYLVGAILFLFSQIRV